MKIRLSLTRNYCPDWGIREGVREIIQNYLDAPGDKTITHFPDVCSLEAVNYGVTINRADVGLLGRTSKGPEDRGQFGEGLKIGVLALLRYGMGVEIRSGDYSYRACFEYAEEFGEDVLCFDCESSALHVNRVFVRITGLFEATWRYIREDFLDLREKPRMAHVVEGGEILLDPEEKGRVYCKGIFVRKYEDLDQGYNFTGTTRVDRDRRMVDDFDLNWELSRMKAARLKSGDAPAEEFLEDLEQGGRATRHAVHFLEPVHKTAVAEAFEAKHGSRAVAGAAPPGLKSVTVPRQLEEVLADHRTAKIAAAEGAIREVIDYEDLDPGEAGVLDAVMFLLEKAKLAPYIGIAVFESPTCLFSRVDDKIYIPRHSLESESACLRRIVLALPDESLEVYSRIVAALRGWDV